MMGAGKSTVARLVAARSARPHVDTDDEVEQAARLDGDRHLRHPRRGGLPPRRVRGAAARRRRSGTGGGLGGRRCGPRPRQPSGPGDGGHRGVAAGPPRHAGAVGPEPWGPAAAARRRRGAGRRAAPPRGRAPAVGTTRRWPASSSTSTTSSADEVADRVHGVSWRTVPRGGAVITVPVGLGGARLRRRGRGRRPDCCPTCSPPASQRVAVVTQRRGGGGRRSTRVSPSTCSPWPTARRPRRWRRWSACAGASPRRAVARRRRGGGGGGRGERRGRVRGGGLPPGHRRT